MDKKRKYFTPKVVGISAWGKNHVSVENYSRPAISGVNAMGKTRCIRRRLF